jgi:hypothetical protein
MYFLDGVLSRDKQFSLKWAADGGPKFSKSIA